jgi:two-component system NarL family sensor kinase
MKISFLFCLLCIRLGSLQAQETTVKRDSLLQVIRSTNDDTNKVKTLLTLADLFENNEPEKAISYNRQAGSLSNRLGYEKGIMTSYRNLAYIYTLQSRYDSLLHFSKLVYEMAERKNDTYNMGVSLFNMGEAFKFLGDYEKCIDYTFRAIKILQGKGYHAIEAHLFSGLQSTYYKLKQYDRSIEYGLKGIELARQNKNENILMVLLENMGHCYTDIKQYTKAEQLFDEAIDLAHKNQNKFTEIICYEGKVDIALNEKRYSDIKKYADRTMQLSLETGDSSGICVSSHNLGLYHLLTKDYEKAYAEGLASLKIARENKFIEHEAKILHLLAAISAARSDISGSIEFSKLAGEINDKIFTDGVAKKDAQMRALYETAKKEDQIELQQAQLKQKSTLNYFLIVGVGALLIISLLGYRNYKHRQKLQQVKIEELETEKILTATAAVLKGEEQERSRLAKDLHDGLGGMLSGIKHSLSSMKENLIMTPDNAQAFERSIDMLNSSISEMRRVAHNMMPEMLVKYGLDTALKEFCNEITASGAAKVNYQAIGMDNANLDQMVSVAIYRIAQELVNNAVKHGKANDVLVQLHLHQQEKLLALTVEDDGLGFDVNSLNDSKGIGWKNIQSRVDLLKGTADVQSVPGSGTSVMIEINT